MQRGLKTTLQKAVSKTLRMLCRVVVNPLSPNSDQHQISPHHINALQLIKVMRIKEMIAKDELS